MKDSYFGWKQRRKQTIVQDNDLTRRVSVLTGLIHQAKKFTVSLIELHVSFKCQTTATVTELNTRQLCPFQHRRFSSHQHRRRVQFLAFAFNPITSFVIGSLHLSVCQSFRSTNLYRFLDWRISWLGRIKFIYRNELSFISLLFQKKPKIFFSEGLSPLWFNPLWVL